jgi:hypothetical protein
MKKLFFLKKLLFALAVGHIIDLPEFNEISEYKINNLDLDNLNYKLIEDIIKYREIDCRIECLKILIKYNDYIAFSIHRYYKMKSMEFPKLYVVFDQVFNFTSLDLMVELLKKFNLPISKNNFKVTFGTHRLSTFYENIRFADEIHEFMQMLSFLENNLDLISTLCHFNVGCNYNLHHIYRTLKNNIDIFKHLEPISELKFKEMVDELFNYIFSILCIFKKYQVENNLFRLYVAREENYGTLILNFGPFCISNTLLNLSNKNKINYSSDLLFAMSLFDRLNIFDNLIGRIQTDVLRGF